MILMKNEELDGELDKESHCHEVAFFLVDNFTEQRESQHNIDTSNLLCAECHVRPITNQYRIWISENLEHAEK